MILDRIRAAPGDVLRWLKVKWQQLRRPQPPNPDRQHLDRTVRKLR